MKLITPDYRAIGYAIENNDTVIIFLKDGRILKCEVKYCTRSSLTVVSGEEGYVFGCSEIKEIHIVNRTIKPEH